MLVRELFTRLSFKTDARGADVYDRRLEQTKQRASNTALAVGGAFAGMGAMVGATIAAAALQVAGALAALPLGIVKAGDEMQKHLNMLTGLLGNTAEGARTYELLYQAALQSGAGMEDLTAAFGRYDLALKKAGKSTDEVVEFISTLQQAMRAYGVQGEAAKSVTLQLGQSLSGAMQGEELNSLVDAMPHLVEALREGFGAKDFAEFKKMVEDGKVTAEKLLPIVTEFSAKAAKRAAEMPMTFATAWKIFGAAWDRFRADIDVALGASDKLVRALEIIVDQMELWRAKIPVIREWIASLGDLRTNLASIAVIIGVIAAAQIDRLVMAFALLALKAAALVAAFLFISDFFYWLQGKDSLIGRAIGPFEDISKQVVAQIEEMRTKLLEFFGMDAPKMPWVDELKRQFAEMFGESGNLFSMESTLREWELLKSLVSVIWDVLRAIGGFLRGEFNQAVSSIGEALAGWRASVDWVASKFDAMRRSVEALRNAAPLGDPGGFGVQNQGLQMPQVGPGATIGPAGAANTSQNNSIQNNVTVNATGASGAEVAAGTRSGVAQAARDMIADLGGAARALSMSNPRAETAAA